MFRSQISPNASYVIADYPSDARFVPWVPWRVAAPVAERRGWQWLGALYPAKVAGVSPPSNAPHAGFTAYLVHYNGWKKRYDEWLQVRWAPASCVDIITLTSRYESCTMSGTGYSRAAAAAAVVPRARLNPN